MDDRESKSPAYDSDDEERPNSPLPINLGDKPPGSSDTGFLIVRLKHDGPGADANEIAKRTAAVLDRLTDFDLTARPLISPENAAKLRKVEETTRDNKYAPGSSLLSYWRVDARESPRRLEEIEAELRKQPEVDLVYREKAVSDPVTPANDTHSAKEGFLKAAPAGVDARWVWTQPHGDGSAMRFIDLEQGWILDHEDLPTLPNPVPIFNDNHDGIDGFTGDHGAAVLGIVCGVDNARGIIGIAPNVVSARAVSHWNQVTGLSNIPDAIVAAITDVPPPHVLLLEVQQEPDLLPIEADFAVFTAIRQAVAAGIIVVEAGGNGNKDLDNWTDASGGHRLNRNSPQFKDSGAILVGAGRAKTPHHRSTWPGGEGSNYGSRVDCYAWGNGIVSAGYGSLNNTFGASSYTDRFGGTSGAASIIAGCALLVQGLRFGVQNSLFSPEEMRTALADVETGTPQGNGGHIGVMPDLRAVVQKRIP